MIVIQLPDGEQLQMPTDDLEQAKNVAAQYYAEKLKNKKPSQVEAEEVTVEEPKKIKIDRSGVQNASLRRYLARAETDEETELRLKESGFTPEMYQKDPEQEGYLLDLNRIPDSLKKQYDLKGTGLLSIEDKGFTRRDIGEFFSKHRGPIIGGTVGSLAATGFGLPIAMLLAGGGSALGYLLDEGLEYSGGLQAQTGEEVARQAAYEGLFGVGGEVGGRALASLLGRAIKGKGGTVANEQRAAAKEALDADIRPTVMGATGAPILGRLQAIYEGVFPQPEIAKKNAEALANEIKKLRGSDVTDVDVEAFLGVVNRDIDNIYGDSEALVRDAQKNLKEVVGKELEGVRQLIRKGVEGDKADAGTVIAGALQNAKRIFDEDSKVLFDAANETFQNERIINIKNVKQVFDNIDRTNPGRGLKESNFGRFFDSKELAGQNFMVDVKTAANLRSTIGSAAYDTNIIGAPDTQVMAALNKAINDSFQSTEAYYAHLAKQFDDFRAGKAPQPRGKTGFIKEDRVVRDGFDQLRKANAHYSQGIEKFRNVFAEKLFKDFETRNFNPERLISPQFGLIVKDNGAQLNQFLKAIIPSGKDPVRMPTLEDVVPKMKIILPDGSERAMIDVISELQPTTGTGLNIVPGDPLRRYYDGILADQTRVAEKLAELRGQGVSQRESVRRLMAGSYFDDLLKTNTDAFGNADVMKVSQEIQKLGSTADVLFKGDLESLDKVLLDFAATGKNVRPEDLSNLRNLPIAEQIERMQGLVKLDKDTKAIPYLKQLKAGAVAQDPDKIVNVIFKKDNALAINTAKKDLSPELMDQVENIALTRILAKAGDSSVGNTKEFVDLVASGKYSASLKKTLDAYKRGSLEAMFGKEVTDGLYRLVNLSYQASNEPIKGLGALAPASIATGLGILAYLTNPFQTLATVAGIAGMAKFLRMKGVLNLITQPKGVRPGAGDFDRIGAAFEAAYRIAAQQQAAAASEIRERTSEQVQRTQDQISQLSQPVQTAARAATAPRTRDGLLPPLNPAPVPKTRDGLLPPLNPALLGSNPITQAKNQQIAERLR